jgi:hypothetical protein
MQFEKKEGLGIYNAEDTGWESRTNCGFSRREPANDGGVG